MKLCAMILCALLAGNLSAQTTQTAVTPPEQIERRYCGPPPGPSPEITAANAAVRAAFQRTYRCPSTQQTTGSCPGWVMDWVIPTWAGGCYAIINMQWLPSDYYTCDAMQGRDCKRRWDGMVYVFRGDAQP